MAQFTLGNTQKSSRLGRSYTLDDLEDNEEFQEISERFLTSVGERSDDVFEYLRDSDYNLFSGMQRAVESGKFTDQQKQDYKYLRKRFDNADMGSFKQYLSLTKDVAIDIVTDPTAMLAVLATPITGGASLALKAGISKSVIEGTKAIATSKLKNVSRKQIAKTSSDGIKAEAGALKDVGRKQIGKAAAITGAEVGTWVGLDNHFKQNTEVNTGIRKLYSNTELAGSAAIGVLTGGILGGFVQRNELFNSRVSRLFTNDTYRKESALKYKIKKSGAKFLAKTIGNASTIMKPFAKYSDAAADLGQRFSEEFAKKLGERSTKRIGWSYFEDLNNRRGNYLLEFDNLLAPIRKTGHVLPDDELTVIRILRGPTKGPNGEIIDFSIGARQEVKKVAKDLRKFFDKIDADAKAAGMETNTVQNYFTRHWNREAIEKNRTTFENKLVKDGIVKRKDVNDVVNGMLNKENELYSSHSNLISQARVFKNMNDNKYEAFLTNDLVPVTTNYYMNAAKTIEHKLHFLGAGKNVKVLTKYKVKDGADEETRMLLFKQSNDELFKKKWIDKIEKELRDNGGQTLTLKDKKDILNTYKSITGQVKYFDSGLMQGTYDTMKLANAMAYLPLATVSSLSEAFITLARAPIKSSVKGYQDGVTKGHKILTDELEQLLKEKHKMTDEAIRREMNSIFIAVDEAMGDVTNRISGEGLQSPFLQKAARGFYRFNLLIPWTKTVQLAAFSTGKDLIAGNLRKLSVAQKQGKLSIKDFASDNFAQDVKVQKLKGELFDLGIDVETGIQWINRGEKNNVKFYKEVVRGAGRFTNGVILPTSRESARVTTFMTNPRIDIFTQFLRYPTVFGNTILKNFARDTITNPTASAPKIAAFVAIATNVAKATNYWRSSEEKRDKIDRGKDDWQDTLKAYQRVGLLGPIEYGLRFSEGLTYGQNPLVAGIGLGGPVLNDVVGMTLYNRGLIETIARKVPLTGTKTVFDRNLGDFMEEYTGFREPYTPLQKAGKEATKYLRGNIKEIARDFSGAPKEKQGLFSERLFKFEGGLVPKVDPYTGIPYEIKEHQIELYSGGLASKMYERKAYKAGLSVSKDVPDVEDNPADRSINGTGQSFREVAGQDTEAKTPDAVKNVPLVEQQPEESDMKRVDGTQKSSQGFLGPILNNITGQTMTEVSLQFDDVLEGAPIPALVPTLTEEEISVLQNMDIEGNAEEIPQEIKVKAIDHALERVEQGLSPFFNERVGYNEAGLVELPRGVRNNNRFNLAIGALNEKEQIFKPYNRVAAYHGVIGTDSVGIGTIKKSGDRQLEAYPIFKTQELGDRAGMHNLIKKYNNQTVDEIFSTYSRTDKDTYAKNVGLLTGLNRNAKLDIKNNPKLAAELARGLIILENGLTEDNQTTHLIPSRQTLIQAHKDSQVSEDDSKYSKTEWKIVKKELQKTILNLFK